ncbi:MAG: GNAT family N-acetyltransferase [Clostridiales bacterium]|jgi:ribosomal protein S18 acetylase RimI-like enzyme|nr:GNAT family N-acetyltransferase [Clostridiales bacterium]
MGFTFKENHPIDTDTLIGLYNSVGWTVYANNRSVMGKLFSGSLYHLSAWRGEELVGLLRAVGDGASILYIQDILVRPDVQRQGLGSQLVKQTLEKFSHIRQIVLMTDREERTLAFYRSLGFEDVESMGCRAFMKINQTKN